MRSHIKLGRIFGIEIGIHYSWFIIALLIMFSLADHFRTVNKDWTPGVIWGASLLTSLLFFLGLLAHELSHSLVAKARKLPVSRITLFALGGVSVIEKESPDAKTEFLVAVVGPITSVVIGGVMMLIAHLMGPNPDATPGAAILWWLGRINILLGVFNMLPGFPLDGGRVLRSILWGAMHNMERATRAASRVGQVVAILFIVFGIWEFFAGQNYGGLWIAFIGWFLLQAAGANYLEVEMKHALQGVRASDLMSHDCPLVEGRISVQDFVDQFLLRTGRRFFLVTVMDRMAGLITPHEVRSLDRELWAMTPLQQIMKPLDRIRSVAPETPVTDVLELMGKEDLNQVPVVANGGLQGMLTRNDILQALRARIELKKAS
ncbi:MAG TPA: site-2 protease family protein [Candidatus Acidoferrales bacterium]|jgi:Zn-dependent protease|nr:site-2 protease family protein [Candidatus Acidoferrales bacterium]